MGAPALWITKGVILGVTPEHPAGGTFVGAALDAPQAPRHRSAPK